MSYHPDCGYPPPCEQPPTCAPCYPPVVQSTCATNTVVVQQPHHFAVHHATRPSDYLILSIISIFFCWPMAICAIMYSLNSRSASDCGNYAKAESEGHTARNIGVAAIIISIVIITISIAVPLAMAASFSATYCTGFNCDY